MSATIAAILWERFSDDGRVGMILRAGESRHVVTLPADEFVRSVACDRLGRECGGFPPFSTLAVRHQRRLDVAKLHELIEASP